jgi:hypothetical protein
MIRTQIQLTEEQARLLRQAARERGVSMALLDVAWVDAGTHEGASMTCSTETVAS